MAYAACHLEACLRGVDNGRPRGPAPACRICPASRVIKPFVRPVCRGRPACRFLLEAEHVAPTHMAPWVRTRLPRGLRASSSRHLQRGSCLASRRCGLLILLCPSWGGAPTLWGPPARPWAGVVSALSRPPLGTEPGPPRGRPLPQAIEGPACLLDISEYSAWNVRFYFETLLSISSLRV